MPIIINGSGSGGLNVKGSEGQLVSFDSSGKAVAIDPPAILHVGASAPSNTNMLWLDTNTATGGLKYYNGSSWAHIPVVYT